MSSQLTSDQIDTHGVQHLALAGQLENRRGQLKAKRKDLIERGASLADINDINEKIQEINSRHATEIRKANHLDALAIKKKLASTDVTNAMEAINKASEQVKKAVEKIEGIKRVLEYIDLFIRLGGAIANAAITGTPAAQIKAIIEEIDKLYKKDFPTN